MSDGLRIRDAAKLLEVHENTVSNMMKDGRLEWYFLNGRNGNRRVRAGSIVKMLQNGMIQDWCGLCPYPLSKHVSAVEAVVVDGKSGVRPIGWQCPKPNDVKELEDGTRNTQG